MENHKIYYIVEPNTKKDRELIKSNPNKFPYMASDMSFMPEGYLMSEEQLSECEQSIIAHRIPDNIIKNYNDISDLISDYWDGEIIWK